MKRKTTIGLLSAVIGFSMVATVTGAISWFAPTASIDNSTAPIEGVTEGAYFAYGDGSDGNPYGISKPRHLYNLAWLTYLGYFKTDQFHFELANDINMSGWVLPPIGTTRYPFIGEFDGKDFIVSNSTVSNQFSDYGTKHPGTVISDNFATGDVNIVGFFGVVGNYPGNSNTATYVSSTNTLSDFGLTNVTVKTYAANTLIGMVAGYSNADITNVAVNTGNVNVATGAGAKAISPATNVSEHGIIGYTTKTKDIRKVNETIYAVNVRQKDNNKKSLEFNATDQGDTTGWGGSINMLSLYQRIYNMSRLASQLNPFTWKNKTTHNVNGTTSNTPYTFTSGATTELGTYTFRSYTGRPAAGVLHYANRNDSERFRYIGGGSLQVDEYYTKYTHTGFPISDGTNYLNLSGANLANGTASATATLWTVPSPGSTGTISTTYDGTTYYLRNNGGTLETYSGGQTGSGYRTVWTVADQGNSRITISNGTSKIHYYNGAWQLIPTTDSEAFNAIQATSGGTTHYISSASSSGNAPSDTTSVSSAAHFLVEASTNYVYFLNGNTKMYLAYYYRNQYYDQGLRIINRSGQNYHYYFTYSAGVLAFTYSGTPYYMTYSNGWGISGSNQGVGLTSYEATAYSTMYLQKQNSTTHYGPDNFLDDSRRTVAMDYTATNTTYLPLNVTSDGGGQLSQDNARTKIETNHHYDPKDSNTGYIVSGYNFNSSTNLNTLSGDNANKAANIRVSEYPISNINSSYVAGDGGIVDSKVYTINTSNQIVQVSTVSSGFEKYSDSKTDFYNNALLSKTNVYGLHFMNSVVSMDHIVPAQNVSIFGEIRKNNSTNAYQMPVNTIDFNLKQRGYINFFAGTYFSGNNSFFSLHKIKRAANTDINAIKTITAVYGDGVGSHSYIYQYSDNTYSEPYVLDGTGDKYRMNADGSIKTQVNPETGKTENVPYVENDSLSLNEAKAYTTYKTGDNLSAPLFRTAQIGVNASISSSYTNRLFYFEIPMNEGEYCLGSVDGGTGGYLLYLDIGANAAKTQRTIISERFISEERKFTYPVGVAFLPYNDKGIDDTNSVAMTIPAGFAAVKARTLTVSRADNAVTITESTEDSSSITLTGDLMFLGDSITIAPNIKAKLKPKSTTTKDVKRVQYVDYNVNLEQVTRTVITDVTTVIKDEAGTVTSNTTARTIEQFDQNGAAIPESKWKIFRTSNGVSYDIPTLRGMALDGSFASGGIGWENPRDDAHPDNNVLLSFFYNKTEAVTGTTETITLNYAVDPTNTDGQYYAFSGYAFVIASTGDGFVIKVLAVDADATVTINGTDVTTVGQTITVSASQASSS